MAPLMSRAGIAVQKGDLLALLVNGISAVTVRLLVNFVPDSTGQAFTLTIDLVSSTDRSQFTTTKPVPEDGVIASAEIIIATGAIPAGPGEIFAQGILYRSNQADAQGIFVSGYVHGANAPSYPWPGIPTGIFDGRGRIRVIALGDPAAGADYADQTVPTNAFWKVRGFAGIIVAAVAASTREFDMIATDGTNVIGVIGTSDEVVTSGQTANFRGGPGPPIAIGQSTIQSAFRAVALNEFPLPAGFVVRFLTTGIQGADDWGAGQLVVEEWIDP